MRLTKLCVGIALWLALATAGPAGATSTVALNLQLESGFGPTAVWGLYVQNSLGIALGAVDVLVEGATGFSFNASLPGISLADSVYSVRPIPVSPGTRSSSTTPPWALRSSRRERRRGSAPSCRVIPPICCPARLRTRRPGHRSWRHDLRRQPARDRAAPDRSHQLLWSGDLLPEQRPALHRTGASDAAHGPRARGSRRARIHAAAHTLRLSRVLAACALWILLGSAGSVAAASTVTLDLRDGGSLYVVNSLGIALGAVDVLVEGATGFSFESGPSGVLRCGLGLQRAAHLWFSLGCAHHQQHRLRALRSSRRERLPGWGRSLRATFRFSSPATFPIPPEHRARSCAGTIFDVNVADDFGQLLPVGAARRLRHTPAASARRRLDSHGPRALRDSGGRHHPVSGLRPRREDPAQERIGRRAHVAPEAPVPVQVLGGEQRAHEQVGDEPGVERPGLARAGERERGGDRGVRGEERAPEAGHAAAVAALVGVELADLRAREALDRRLAPRGTTTRTPRAAPGSRVSARATGCAGRSRPATRGSRFRARPPPARKRARSPRTARAR